MILPATAAFTGGICMPCHKSLSYSPPEPDPEEAVELSERIFQVGLDIDAAVAAFLVMGETITKAQSVTGLELLNRVLDWYRNTRIARTVLEEDGDMLLLEWGATQPMELSRPTDMRGEGSVAPQFSQARHRWLGFTRQAWPLSENEQDEFDGRAVVMCVFLAYELADGSEPSGNTWIHSPENMDDEIRDFMNPYVTQLLKKPANLVWVFACYCG
jgi:hypothetical protein